MAQPLTQDHLIDYLGKNEDWLKFTNRLSDNTGNHYESLWLKNASTNAPLVKKHGWATEALQGAHKGKTSILVGASPALRNQVDQLRELQSDPDIVMVGLSSGLRFLVGEGIIPRYVMIADADPAIERFWRDMDMKATEKMTLIANICTAPALLDMWRGDIRFLALYTAIPKVDRKLRKKYSPLNGAEADGFFYALFSQYNTGAALAFCVFETKVLIFVGNELGFKDREVTYYVDRTDEKDAWARGPHPDIYGDVVYTNMMFMSLKMALEDFLAKVSGDGWFFNCTEAGIFGITRRYGNLPWIHQMKLRDGIAQARMIMRTGKPMYGG